MGLLISPVVASGGGGGSGSGDVVGPASSTDNAVVRFDGTTGLLIQNSGVLIDDSNNLTLPGSATIGSASADYTVITGGTGVTTFTATGSSTNINISLVPKGTTGQVMLGAGTVSNVAITLGAAGVGTGFYSTGVNETSFAIAGTRRWSFQSNSFRGIAGSASAPNITTIADPDTGMWVATGVTGFTVDATEIGQFNVNGLNIVTVGSAATPSIRINSTNSGFFAPTTNRIALSTNAAQIWAANSADGMIMSRRFQLGATNNLASATSLTLGSTGNVFPITGSTTISRITATDWSFGAEVKLQLPSGITVEHLSASGTGAQINLAGAANLTTAAVTYLHLMYDGSAFVEMYRRVMP